MAKKACCRRHENYINQISLRHIAESVAHEVRNPIVSIGGYTNLLIKMPTEASAAVNIKIPRTSRKTAMAFR